jgi:hypothetical protein
MTISFWTGFTESTLSKSPNPGSLQAGEGIDSNSRAGFTATSSVGVSLLGYGHLSEDMVDSLASVSERRPPRRKMRDERKGRLETGFSNFALSKFVPKRS